ncbi:MULTISPECIES: pyridoxamine 5'-phosphate oxidase family protein [unclassified Stenotrophomonas]|uniref:pyridoxamine 5'-phosphate oxidase family protein n=1 Tax=unclassified Stenotrophomonas TaxID=196198 RepID=UPI0013113927|nr:MULTISPECIES: pyridoxamine 5'-phosphate oxidase family protein [unclassified Stenotrophomonas]
MTTLTLPELAKKMANIDFTMLQTRAENGEIAGRPMSNNGDVDYDGDSWFFTTEDTDMVREIQQDPKVALSFTGSKSLLGKPPLFVAVQGRATLIRDKAIMQQHWVKDLERWFEQGVDSPGLVLIQVAASRIHYWDGEDQGEILR